MSRNLQFRWLGKTSFADAEAIQNSLFSAKGKDYMLLLEHLPVYTQGIRASQEEVLVKDLGAPVVKVKRGGATTFHGLGQLVIYPVVDLAPRSHMSTFYVNTLENLIIEVLAELGITNVGRLAQYPGVWVDPNGSNARKIAAIGTRISKGRTMHGAALNVSTDLSMFENIVPCGISDKAVTSVLAEGITTSLHEVVDLVEKKAAAFMAEVSQDSDIVISRQDVAWKNTSIVGQKNLIPKLASKHLTTRLNEAFSSSSEPVKWIETKRKPPWLRAKFNIGQEYKELRSTLKGFDLATVCEEAGCPNIYECWNQGTATFMINGTRCTRACAFCLVDTRRPLELDHQEPMRVAQAVKQMNLSYVVLTAVARDDLEDGGASGFVSSIEHIRRLCPQVSIEILIPDFKSNLNSLEKIFSVAPEVLNHNLETVPRLQRAIRPSASYATSLAVLARAKQAGLVTKSGLILGMGETEQEISQSIIDLGSIGVDILTLGQYLRPSSNHLPISRWVEPKEFEDLKEFALGVGFSHVESSPLTRSSYHAKAAAQNASSLISIPVN